MTRHDLPEDRLARLIGATRAEPNSAVLARAQAKLAARPNAPRLAEWLARPAVLVGASVVFALCVAGAFTVSRRPDAAATDPGLIAALLGEDDLGLFVGTDGTNGMNDTNGPDDPNGGAGDSGKVTP